MLSDPVISVSNLTKQYQLYDKPSDRLKQFLVPRLQKAAFLTQKNYYKTFCAIKNVSFQVKKGETIGIVGKNGSGKSTLLQLICGIIEPTCGQVSTAGRIAALLELGSGFNPEFTGRENVFLNATVLGMSKAEILEKFEAIETFADIGEFIDQSVKTYSSGMLVRLAFSVAIHCSPSILVVDEALAVGDELFQRKCFSRIDYLRSQGTTILFVSHSGSQVIELCDRALLMDAGEMILEGEPKFIVGLYHKLLYASMQLREEIKDSLRNSNAGFQVSADSNDVDCNLVGDNESESIFDPSLISKSVIYYESRGAEINDVVLLDELGNRVNILRRGKRYTCRYHVVFSQPATRVRFGILIKTLSGVELGGAVSSTAVRNPNAFIEGGASYVVRFTFTAMLNEGIYFMNAGVVGEIFGDEIYLHRITDALTFKIMPSENSITTGIVDFDPKPMVQVVSQI